MCARVPGVHSAQCYTYDIIEQLLVAYDHDYASCAFTFFLNKRTPPSANVHVHVRRAH